MDNIIIINSFILILLIVFIVKYCINIKIPYPKWIVFIINEPILRFNLYITIYILSFYNPIISLYLLIIILFIHIDYINLMTIQKQKSY
jgi:hypothetical protein